MLFLNVCFFADDLKIYLKIRLSNIVDMSSDLSSFQRDIDTIVHVATSCGLQVNVEKGCVIGSEVFYRNIRHSSVLKLLCSWNRFAVYVRIWVY